MAASAARNTAIGAILPASIALQLRDACFRLRRLGGDRGDHPAPGERRDAVRAHVEPLHVERDRLRQRGEPELRRGVVRLADVADQAGGGGHVDVGAAAPGRGSAWRRRGSRRSRPSGGPGSPPPSPRRVILWNRRSRRMPALFTTQSMRPKASSAVCTMRLALAQSATLSVFAIASPPPARISSTTLLGRALVGALAGERRADVVDDDARARARPSRARSRARCRRPRR